MTKDTDYCWEYNVKDEFKSWTVGQIKDHLKKTANPFAVMMSQVKGDYNFGSVVRGANAFNAERVYYFGKKKWRRTSSLGTHHYTDVQYIDSFEEINKLREKYWVVGVEDDERAVSLYDMTIPIFAKTLFILGEENHGLSTEILDICDEVIKIPTQGSVRSMNLAVAGGIVMSEYIRRREAHRSF